MSNWKHDHLDWGLNAGSNSHWKQKPFEFNYDWSSDDLKLEYELDVQGYVLELTSKLIAAEEDVAEPVVVEWLRSRGYRVEKGER